MNKENEIILLNQLRIMSAMQRLEYFVHQQEIEDDLSEGIENTQKFLMEKIDSDISMMEENTNLKQALNEIREYIVSHELDNNNNFMDSGVGSEFDYILKIIDKYMKEEK